MKAAVIGGGSWGTALASVLADIEPVQLWARDPLIAQGISQSHRNPKYLSDFELSPNLIGTTDFQACLKGANLVCIVVPSHAMRTVMSRAAQFIEPNALIACASKGIENDSLMTMEEVLVEVLPLDITKTSDFYRAQASRVKPSRRWQQPSPLPPERSTSRKRCKTPLVVITFEHIQPTM